MRTKKLTKQEAQRTPKCDFAKPTHPHRDGNKKTEPDERKKIEIGLDPRRKETLRDGATIN